MASNAASAIASALEAIAHDANAPLFGRSPVPSSHTQGVVFSHSRCPGTAQRQYSSSACATQSASFVWCEHDSGEQRARGTAHVPQWPCIQSSQALHASPTCLPLQARSASDGTSAAVVSRRRTAVITPTTV